MKKTTTILKTSLIAAGLVAAWEAGATLWEKQRWLNGKQFWRNYYPAEVVQRSDALRREESILSTGVRMHMDIYPRLETDAPVLIFNHGAAGYCRLFVTLALAFYDRGYTVILPDQRGQGLSGGRRGDYTVAECVQNIVDAALWARQNYSGQVFLAGGSVGGAYTYYAAAAGAPVEAIACVNLFDFGRPTDRRFSDGRSSDGLSISRLSGLTRFPRLAGALAVGFKLLAPLGWLRLPFAWFGAFDHLMDDRDRTFQAAWDADPIPPRFVTLRSLTSALWTSPAIPFEENAVPTLVFNQTQDRMVDPAVTLRNYNRLSGPKRYLELPFGHWSSQPGFWESIVQACDGWFQECGPHKPVV